MTPRALAEIVDFLERMAEAPDRHVGEVLRDTVLEHVRDEPPHLVERAIRHMGPDTLVHWKKVAGCPRGWWERRCLSD